ncbi:hypothetical protein FOZ63_026702 [Perkinsus olseni]|uniref:Uncharacterized protein n=1 Tax=Perkinsus olseni TaxID=32597 RepID=A0A7J6QKE1_PEROL|nr:hypothetical protein FOZ62_031057 [Perkinsus olseni]KAF4708601.1 hypothetical protein FOZ63_026702 [Perkinsus olseni]
MRQHALPDIRTQMRHNLEEAARIPKVTVFDQPAKGARQQVVRPAMHQGFQTAMALNGALDGERSMVGHADIKEIARDVMGDAGKALYHFDKFQAMTEKLRDEMKPMDHDLKIDSMANLWLMSVCHDDEISDTAVVGNFLCSFLIVLASLDVCTRAEDRWPTKEIVEIAKIPEEFRKLLARWKNLLLLGADRNCWTGTYYSTKAPSTQKASLCTL